MPGYRRFKYSVGDYIIMLRKSFIDREREMNFLRESQGKKGLEFVVVTGRRRTGKSRLLKEFEKNKDCISLLCEDKNWKHNLAKFNKVTAKHYNMPNPDFKSFNECFEYIAKQTEKKEGKLLIVIDEFSYLIKKSSVVAEFQTIVDETLSEKNAMLVLSGSAVSMMKKRVLGRKSPLYGRTTGQIFLQPLKFKHLLEWFDKTPFEDVVKIFGVCDGIPKYLEFFDGKNPEKEIIQNLFNPNSFLFREPKSLLEEELRKPETYFQILEAISLGHTKVVEIANYCYMNAKDMSSYLSILIDLGFVKKEKQVTAKKRKRGIYKVKDQFFKSWFRFVSPYFEEINNWETESATSEFKKGFNQYLGTVFEKVAAEALTELIKQKKAPELTKIGRWWHKDKEIDIVALNDNTKEILFCECKWKNKVNAEKVLAELKEKAQHVQWNNQKRKEHYAIFAKSFKKKIGPKEKNVHLYNLKGLEKAFKK